MGIKCDYSAWETERRGNTSEMYRDYHFSGLAGEGSETQVSLRLRLVKPESAIGKLTGLFREQPRIPFVYFVIEPYIVEHTGMIMAQFGVASVPLVNHTIFPAKVEAIASGANFVLFGVENSQPALDALKRCEPLVLNLLSMSQGPLGRIPLENDLQFATQYSLFEAFSR